MLFILCSKRSSAICCCFLLAITAQQRVSSSKFLTNGTGSFTLGTQHTHNCEARDNVATNQKNPDTTIVKTIRELTLALKQHREGPYFTILHLLQTP